MGVILEDIDNSDYLSVKGDKKTSITLQFQRKRNHHTCKDYLYHLIRSLINRRGKVMARPILNDNEFTIL